MVVVEDFQEHPVQAGMAVAEQEEMFQEMVQQEYQEQLILAVVAEERMEQPLPQIQQQVGQVVQELLL